MHDTAKLAETPASTVVVADNFSCRGRIEQLGHRNSIHIAQLVQLALRQSR